MPLHFKKKIISGFVSREFYRANSYGSLFGDISKLDVNPKKVFGRYRNNSKLLSTVNSGLFYDMAYKTMIEDKQHDFLMPIIFACDETK